MIKSISRLAYAVYRALTTASAPASANALASEWILPQQFRYPTLDPQSQDSIAPPPNPELDLVRFPKVVRTARTFFDFCFLEGFLAVRDVWVVGDEVVVVDDDVGDDVFDRMERNDDDDNIDIGVKEWTILHLDDVR